MNKRPTPPPKPVGGKREGAGRKPDWLKTKCQGLIDKHKLLHYVARVAAGEEQEDRLSKDGDVYQVGVSTHDRLHALEILMERGFGKAVQGVELSGEGGSVLEVIVKEYVPGKA